MLLSEYSIVVSHYKYSLKTTISKVKLPTVYLQQKNEVFLVFKNIYNIKKVLMNKIINLYLEIFNH